jgi:hypothetical protein
LWQRENDPELLGTSSQAVVVSGRSMNADSMGRYLHYCTELLALVSKIGQLYVQDFPYAPSVAAVDQFENLATGLSSKIWQKLMILDRVRSDGIESPRVAFAAPSAPLPTPQAVP